MPNDLLDKIFPFNRKGGFYPDPKKEADLDSFLSTHFQLKELCITSHREINNYPPLEVVVRLTGLCVYILEPIRSVFGPIHVNSGYRCPELNKAIGGAPNSAHMYGVAGDIVPTNNYMLQQIVDWIIGSNIPFDQVILESSSTANWIHVAGIRPKHEITPRKEALRFKNGKYSKYDRKINYGV